MAVHLLIDEQLQNQTRGGLKRRNFTLEGIQKLGVIFAGNFLLVVDFVDCKSLVRSLEENTKTNLLAPSCSCGRFLMVEIEPNLTGTQVPIFDRLPVK